MRKNERIGKLSVLKFTKDASKLAIFGGKPVRKKPWPKWPRANKNTEKLLKDVLYSGRWTISGPYTGRKSYERQFAEAFAKFNGVSYCVPTVNGSAALTIALEALDVGPGKEVLVPGLTWVACASSVLKLGAMPILIDINPDTLCMSLKAARKAITKNTTAIILVHLYSCIADIDGFLKLSDEAGIPIIEDCSHVHGAIWKGQRVGSFGSIGVFSMQQSKVLTCGEGGAAITKDKSLYVKMQQLRADGRLYRDKQVDIGQMELEEVGAVQCQNYCMSELHAAILLDRLQHLDEENKIREKNTKYLNSLLLYLGDLIPLIPSKGTDLTTYYQYCIRIGLPAFGFKNIDLIAEALTAELRILIEPVYTPLNNHILYNPLSFSRLTDDSKASDLYNLEQLQLPVSRNAREECLVIPHHVLLASQKGMEDIAEAFLKIKSNFS